MTHSEMQVTPAMATSFLSAQDMSPLKQRRVNTTQVKRYAAMMKAGKWQRNGESLKFSGTQLLDGQHRLYALLEADVTLPFLVVNDINPSSFTTIDQGLSRSVKHLLEMRGCNYTHLIIAVAKRVALYKKYGVVFANVSGSKNKAIDADILMEFIIANGSALQVAAQMAERCKLGHTSILAVVQFLNRGHSRVDEFFDRLRDGITLQKNDPIRLLRDRLLVNRVGAIRRANPVVSMAWCFKAWNAHVRQQPLSRLSYAIEREEFPKLITFQRSTLLGENDDLR
tara:strand:- start:329 stop:1177 length:849 start_codon:yes stop_codon:yes gene_type:complete